MNRKKIDGLLKQFKELEELRAKIIEDLSKEGFKLNPNPQPPIIETSNLAKMVESSPYSLQGKVITAVIQLIKQKKQHVTSQEILKFIQKKDIDLGNYPAMMLAAILGQEVNKRSARLIRVARGLYDIKRETVLVEK